MKILGPRTITKSARLVKLIKPSANPSPSKLIKPVPKRSGCRACGK
jgi:hypothetical protein